jgi:hypothetical protein
VPEMRIRSCSWRRATRTIGFFVSSGTFPYNSSVKLIARAESEAVFSRLPQKRRDKTEPEEGSSSWANRFS